MNELNVGENTVKTKHGRIESTGTDSNILIASYISNVTFDDGDRIKKVMADSSVAPYIQPGISGTFAFMKAGKFEAFLGGQLDGYGYRLGDADNWRSLAKTLNPHIIAGGIGASLMFLAGLVFAFWFIPCALFVAWITPSIMKASQFNNVAKTIEALEGAEGKKALIGGSFSGVPAE